MDQLSCLKIAALSQNQITGWEFNVFSMQTVIPSYDIFIITKYERDLGTYINISLIYLYVSDYYIYIKAIAISAAVNLRLLKVPLANKIMHMFPHIRFR